MKKRGGMACVAIAAALLGACNTAPKEPVYVEKPSADQMREALKNLLVAQPDLAIPEFQLSVNDSPAIPM